MTIQQHIEGLKGIKPFLQKMMLSADFEGMGEVDAEEIGETIDAAIEALELREPKKPRVDKLKYHWACPSCKGTKSDAMFSPRFCSVCGQAIDWGRR